MTINSTADLVKTNEEIKTRIAELEAKDRENANLGKRFETDHLYVNEFAKVLKRVGIKFENLDGTPYEIDENLEIPKELLPKHAKPNKALSKFITN